MDKERNEITPPLRVLKKGIKKSTPLAFVPPLGARIRESGNQEIRELVDVR